jgi:hypothetical protein
MWFRLFSFTILLMLAGLHGHCQHQRVWGIVKDDKGNAIPACTVHATKGGGVAVTDKNGYFLLVTTLPDSVEFYSLGYAKKKIAITGDTMNIVLPQQIATIDEVNVSADHQRRKTKTAIMGKKNLKPYGMFSGFTGNETAIFLKADSSKHGTLNEIFFYILKDGLPNAKFRVHVYDIDTSYLPGQDLLDTTVIASATTGDEWVRVDVSRWHVPVGRGVFISMEWIAGYGNDPRLVKSTRYPAQGYVNGQILSATQGYFKQYSLMYNRAKPGANWGYQVLAGSLKRNVLNPMVYATYTYYK